MHVVRTLTNTHTHNINICKIFFFTKCINYFFLFYISQKALIYFTAIEWKNNFINKNFLTRIILS